MPAQITAETSPAEIEANADSYLELLSKTGLPADRTKIVGDMKRRAAGLQSPALSVEAWEEMWVQRGGGKPEPEPVKETPKKEAPRKKDRGVVTIDRDYFYVTPANAADSNTWVEMNQAGDRMHMLAVGPSGCGKTSLYGEIGKKFGLPVYKVDAAAVTSIDRWLGHKDVRITERGPETTYVMSEFLRWISADGFEPGIVVIDEITRTPPQVANILMSILDGSESIWVPELGITVKVDPRVLFGATANIGVGFSGTYALDQALQDRFGMNLEVTWPSQAEEVKILEKRTGVDTEPAKILVAVADQVRGKYNNGDIAKPVSTRMLLNAARLVARGRTIIDAAEATFVKQYSEEGKGSSERTTVKLILQGLAGKR